MLLTFVNLPSSLSQGNSPYSVSDLPQKLQWGFLAAPKPCRWGNRATGRNRQHTAAFLVPRSGRCLLPVGSHHNSQMTKLRNGRNRPHQNTARKRSPKQQGQDSWVPFVLFCLFWTQTCAQTFAEAGPGTQRNSSTPQPELFMLWAGSTPGHVLSRSLLVSSPKKLGCGWFVERLHEHSKSSKTRNSDTQLLLDGARCQN